MDAFVNRVRFGNVTEAVQQRYARSADCRAKIRMCVEGLQFRSKEKDGAAPAIVERLDAQPVAHQIELPLARVPQGNCEHPDKTGNRVLHSPLRNGREDYFGIGASAKPMA